MDIVSPQKMFKPSQNELSEFLIKWGALGAYITIGLIGKFGYDIVTGRKLNGWYVFGTGCMGIFTGWLVYNMCDNHMVSLNKGIAVPVATLVSRDIMLFITAVDWRSVLTILTGKNTKGKK